MVCDVWDGRGCCSHWVTASGEVHVSLGRLCLLVASSAPLGSQCKPRAELAPQVWYFSARVSSTSLRRLTSGARELSWCAFGVCLRPACDQLRGLRSCCKALQGRRSWCLWPPRKLCRCRSFLCRLPDTQVFLSAAPDPPPSSRGFS